MVRTDYDHYVVSSPSIQAARSDADGRPHFVVCGSDALVYTLADELARSARRPRLTVIVPPRVRDNAPDLDDLTGLGVRVVRSDRLDEKTFGEAGLAGADALALVMPDDMVNLHAALRAREVEGDLRLVIRMFNTSLGTSVRKLFADCAVLSDAAMAAPAFVSAALGEVAPTHFRYAGRTLLVGRRVDLPPKSVVLTLTGDSGVLPPEPEPAAARPSDLVLAEATGRPPRQKVTARTLARTGRRRRSLMAAGRLVREALSRKLGIAVLITVGVGIVAGAVLSRFTDTHGLWQSIYVTLLTVVGSSDVEPDRRPIAQFAQLVLTLAGVATVPLITAAIVDGVVRTRLALDRGEGRRLHVDHVIVVGIGNVGTRVMRLLHDLGLDVVAIDRQSDARGVKIAQQLGVRVIVGDAAREETLTLASVATCKALIVASTDDAVNLEAALHARAVRDDIRVVLRLFDDDFARRVQAAFGISVSRSVSRLAAPAFAGAVLERDVLATIPVDRHALPVAVVTVLPGSALDGQTLESVDEPGAVRLIAMSAAGSAWVDWEIDRRRILTAGDEIVVVARRSGLRHLLELAAPAGD